VEYIHDNWYGILIYVTEHINLIAVVDIECLLF